MLKILLKGGEGKIEISVTQVMNLRGYRRELMPFHMHVSDGITILVLSTLIWRRANDLVKPHTGSGAHLGCDLDF